MKTVAEIAKEVGVSTQAIYKKINQSLRSELSAYIHVVDGQKLIDKEGEAIIKLGLQPVANRTLKNVGQVASQLQEMKIGVTENGTMKTKIQLQPTTSGLQPTLDLVANLDEVEQTGTTSKEHEYADDLVANQLQLVGNQTELIKEIDRLKDSLDFYKKQHVKAQTDCEKAQEELSKEREHSRAQADRLASLAEQLAELSRNNQILLGAEQSRTNPALLPNVGEGDKKPKRKLFGIFGKLKV